MKHGKKMRFIKLAAILTAAALSLSCVLPCFAVTHGAVADLQELAVIDDAPLEELRLGDLITRAELAKLVVRALGLEDVPPGGNPFSDVLPEHWASGYISTCAALSIFNGVGDGCFAPEQTVTLQDVLKTIVIVLGYGVRAESKGGYPAGYMSLAAELKLTSGIDGRAAEPVLRADVFQIFANALDVDRMKPTGYGEGAESEWAAVRGDTLRDNLMERGELVSGVGVVTATYHAYLVNENPVIKEDEVEINGKRFLVGKTNAAKLLGAKVVYTAAEDGDTGICSLVSIHLHRDVECLELTEEEYESYRQSVIEYCQDSADRVQKAQIASDAVVLYNNRPLADRDDFRLQNGLIRMYDNDGDGAYDVVLIEDYMSVFVKSVNRSSCIVRFTGADAYNDPLTGQNALMIALDGTDEDYQTDIRSKDGKKASIEDIEPGTLLSLYVSRDGQYRRAVLGGEVVAGTLEELADTECVIDNVTYRLERKELSCLSDEELSAGAFVRAFISFNGNIGFFEMEEDKNEKFGYLIGQEQRGIDTAEVRLVFAGTVETIEEDKDNDPETTDDITKYLVARNDSVQTKKLSERCLIDGRRMEAGERLPLKVPLKFTMNSQGEIQRINSLSDEIMTENKKYNAAEKVFGNTMGTPFGLGDKTRVLCLPDGEVSRTEDYLAEVRMENGQSYLVSGYEYDEDDRCDVRLFAVTQKMVYDDEPAIGYRTKFAIVDKVSAVLSENGEITTKITLLTEGVRKTMLTADYTSADIDRLKTGDVIYYSQNARREFVDYQLIAELSTDSGSRLDGQNTDDERAFGQLTGIRYDRIEGLRMWRVHELKLLIDNPVPYYLRVNNTPPVFIYDKKRKTVSFAGVDDFRIYSDYVFVHSKSNVPQGFVIVRE